MINLFFAAPFQPETNTGSIFKILETLMQSCQCYLSTTKRLENILQEHPTSFNI